MFALIACDYYLLSFLFFLVAASTDWLDGYFARKYGQVTTLGRILDPFADKVIVCGTFIFLLPIGRMMEIPGGLRAWMVVVIVGRELLVTALRSFFEQRGSDFSAKWSGKLKMALQCVAAGACLFVLFAIPDGQPLPQWLWLVLVVTLWSAVLLTVWSGVVYVWAALRLMKLR